MTGGSTIAKGWRLSTMIVLAGALLLPSAGLATEGLLLFPEGERWRDVSDRIREGGGRVLQAFPPGGAIVEGDDAFWSHISDIAPEWDARFAPAHPPSAERFSREGRFAALAWNRRFEEPAAVPDVAAEAVEPSEPDAALAPRGSAGPSKAPAGANFYDTSEFFLGSVAIAILLPESDGSIDPSTEDWTAGEIDTVVGEVQAGISWWLQHVPGGNLSFVFEVPDPVPCPYEAINHDAFNPPQETLWTASVFDTLGFGTGDVWYSGRAYLNALRDTLGTDWAVAVFVANSKNDTDGKFLNGYHGFSYYGGPYLVVTSDAGPYGITWLDAVTAHEISHSFYALDEYYGAHQGCTKRAGYEWVENENSLYGECLLDEACIMRSPVHTPFSQNAACVYTRGQIGMGDDDSDEIPNILDTYPLTALDAFPDTTLDFTPTFTGTAEVNPAANLNSMGEGNDITLNTIASVEYRIDGGEWAAAEALDGTFDSTWEAFTFTTPALYETLHVFEARAVNSAANAGTTYAADTVTILDVTPPGLVTDLAAGAADSVSILTWTGAADSDYQGVMIRYSTVAAPVDTSEGFLLETRFAGPSEADTAVHTGLFPDTTYFYSFFSMDEKPNYSAGATASATPLFPLPPALLITPAAESLYVAPEPTFVWSAIHLPDPADTLVAYQMQIATDSLFVEVVVDSEVTVGAPADTSWTYGPLESGRWHYWRVRGKDLLSGTYGCWSDGSPFATELLLSGVVFLDSALSDYTNFAHGDSLEANSDACVEVRFQPADTLGIAGFSGWLHYDAGSPDSIGLVWNRNEGGYGYWRADVPFGDAFWRGDTVSVHVSGRSPNQWYVMDKNGGPGYRFVAGRRGLPAYHVPENSEPYASMRYPFIVTDTDPNVTITVAATPAGLAAEGELFYHAQGDPVWSAVPLVADTLIGGVDYFEALVDSTFFLQSTVEYYAKMWGDTTYDTTFVFGEDGSSFVSTVLQSALDGAFWFYVQSVTGVGEGALASLPERNELFANTPNPFNPTTTLPFALSRKGRVTLTLYDARGRRVAVLVDEERPAGFYSVPWNGATGTGADAPSGVYFARIQSGDWTESRKIILIR